MIRQNNAQAASNLRYGKQRARLGTFSHVIHSKLGVIKT